MIRLTRRGVLLSGFGALATGGLLFGGSFATCRLRSGAMVSARPLYVALADLPRAREIGRHCLKETGRAGLQKRLLMRTDLAEVSLLPGSALRREKLAALVQAEFALENVVRAGPYLVSETEALIAGAWVGESITL